MEKGLFLKFPRLGQNQCKTSLTSQNRKATKAKGGNKYNTHVPWNPRFAMLAPIRHR